MTGVYVSKKSGRMSKEVLKLIDEKDDFYFLGELNDIRESKNNAVIIDFSSREFLNPLLRTASEYKIPVVTGTTGFNEDDFGKMKKTAETVPIFYSSNMSLGIAALEKMLSSCKNILGSYDTFIREIHHKNKKDTPSGTALSIKNSLGRDINISSLRAKDVKGIHEITMIGEGEIIEIRHEALSRKLFAEGALKASKFILKKQRGFFTMEDILNEEN